MGRNQDATVFVAVPVYHGTRFVGETLTSILAQTHRALRVMISVDGADHASAETCAPYLADGRVRMVVQERQLGFVANLNALIDACDGDFFCYWQQDDLCAPDYLEKLLAALADQPGAACAYSDLRWFERADNVVAVPDITGFTQERILAQIEGLHWVPLRGLVPVDVLRAVGAIRGLDDGIVFSDYLWVLRLAAAGDLIRVPEVLYRKRDHRDSASHRRSSDNPYSPRESWIRLGLMIHREIAEHFAEADQQRLAVVIADRLVMPRNGRWFGYDPAAVSVSEPASVARDFLKALEAQAGVVVPPAGREEWPSGGPGGPATGRSAEGSVLRLIADAGLAAEERRSYLLAASARGALALSCASDGDAGALLLEGWSQPEHWGTWSDGHHARIWLPVPADSGSWQVRLVGRAYLGAGDGRVVPRLVIRRKDVALIDHRATAETTDLAFRLDAGVDDREGVILSIALPDATSPAALGLGPDERLLSLALERVELRHAPERR